MIEKILQRIDALLKRAHCETLSLGNFARKKVKFCFDLLVKKDNLILNVKIFSNIDNIQPDIIHDIKSLSLILKSKPLLIGIRNRYQKLEDNTIYIRDGLPFITLNTFENILTNNMFPYVLARRGGGVIFLDGHLMKMLREKHSITRKELSERLGVAKRTISAYENESMRPSEKMAEEISNILENCEIFKRINVFEWKVKYNKEKIQILEENELNEFESHVKSIIDDIGISSYWYNKGSMPFKLSMFSSIDEVEKQGFYPLFSAISEDQGKMNELNFKCLKMFNDLFHKTALFIISNDVRVPDVLKNEDIPIVKIKSLEEVNDEEEFIELIQDS